MHVAEPWERRCGICDGTGQVMSMAWAAWHEEYERLESISDLQNRLRALAEHVRQVPAEVEVLICPECGGSGVVVSNQGAALLDFLDRRLCQRAPPSWTGRPPGPPQPPPIESDDTDTFFDPPQRPPPPDMRLPERNRM